MRSSLALVLALVSLLLGSFDFHGSEQHSLRPDLSGTQEIFEAAKHSDAPLHMEGAGTATWRHSCPVCLHLVRSLGTGALPAGAVLRLDVAGASPAANAPRLSSGACACSGSRGPPAALLA